MPDHNTWPDELTEKLKKLWESGRSCSVIGADLGITRSAVIGKVHRLGLPSRKPKILWHGRKQKQKPGPRSFGAPSPPRRRNPSNYDIMAKIAIAAAEPGLPDKLKGAVPDGTGIKLIELTEFTCRWPIGDPKTPEFEFCGARPVPSLPYCAGHCRLSYPLFST